ncbi:MAG TPA: signal peptide peptidase SppA [Bacteroidia bacterium]|nr:signal peptide peptidase SppA [Bacteroidia bacterium]
MKTFFGSMLGSFLGALLGLVIIFFIIIAMFAGLMKSIKTKEVRPVYSNSILEIRLNHEIHERTAESPFNFDFDDNTPARETAGLDDIIASIRHAATDPKIKGIYLNFGDIPAGISTLQTIRKELQDFKTSSGKFVIAYAIGYTQKSYYLASVADKVYLYPQGEIFLKGLSAELMFYKKALDKLGIQIQVFRHGRFKSFVEPYILDKMSPDNKVQLRGLVSSLWVNMLSDIAQSRHLTVGTIDEMADSLSINSAKEALKYKLVDSLLYPDELRDELKNRTKTGGDMKPSENNFVGLDEYRKSFSNYKISSKKIALIYANGDIIQGDGDDQNIGATRISHAIRDARLDNEVKAIVLRVNSPGGDGIASDVIWREVELAKKVKPVIVSMGDYAASGGYYISCAANEIVAEPTTITGSIGVFGLLPNAKELLEDKLGITTDTVSTNTHSAAPSLSYPLETKESMVLQNAIEDFYHTFLSRVAEGRVMTVANVDSIGQGRVWTGEQALKIGLVDTLGSLKVAINIAARKANLGSNYSIEELPHQINPLHKFLSGFGTESGQAFLKNTLGDAYKPIDDITKLQNLKGVQARMPYDINIQ